MRASYDYILIDSRTGVSDTAGICTMQMPEALVVFFTANNQSILGAAGAARSIQRQRTRDTSRQGSDFKVFPVFSRVDVFEMDKLEAAREFAKGCFGGLLEHVSDQAEYWNQIETPYVPFYAYEEVLATFRDKPGEKNSLLTAAEALSRFLTGNKELNLVPASKAEQERVRASFERRRTPPKTLPDEERTSVLVIHSQKDRQWLMELETHSSQSCESSD